MELQIEGTRCLFIQYGLARAIATDRIIIHCSNTIDLLEWKYWIRINMES